MLNYDLRFDEGILVLKPDGPLEVADFRALASQVNAYLDQHGRLRGILIQAGEFPGWENFGALVAHLKFVRVRHRKIEKIAIVSDAAFATLIPKIAGHFVQAKIKHFGAESADAAWNWLVMRGRGWMSSAAA